MRWSSLKLVIAAVAISTVVAACGSDSSGSQPTTTTTTSVCQGAQQLQQSVQDMKNIDVVKNGTSAVTAQFNIIKSQAQALSTSGKSELQPEAQTLQQSVTDLGNTLNASSSTPLQVLNGINSVVAATTALANKASTLKC